MLPAIIKMYQNRPLVFGHRGASAYAPMNTLPTFELALQQSADAIELDVWLSKDRFPIVIHDMMIDNTTNGKGNVNDMSLAELKSLDAGAWFDAKFAGTTIPTLDEVFAAVGQKLFINVEIKSITMDTDGIEQMVADSIAHHNLQERVIVSSFNPLALQRFRAIMPIVPIGYLYDENISAEIKSLMDIIPHEAVHPHHTLIDAQYMAWAREKNFFVNTWTVNEPERVAELAKMGVHGIITDKPDMARGVIDALRR